MFFIRASLHGLDPVCPVSASSAFSWTLYALLRSCAHVCVSLCHFIHADKILVLDYCYIEQTDVCSVANGGMARRKSRSMLRGSLVLMVLLELLFPFFCISSMEVMSLPSKAHLYGVFGRGEEEKERRGEGVEPKTGTSTYPGGKEPAAFPLTACPVGRPR